MMVCHRCQGNADSAFVDNGCELHSIAVQIMKQEFVFDGAVLPPLLMDLRGYFLDIEV